MKWPVKLKHFFNGKLYVKQKLMLVIRNEICGVDQNIIVSECISLTL